MILVAPDKFKGTYSAGEICLMAEQELRKAGYDGEIALRPMSDGGEGIAPVVMPGAVKIADGVYRSPDGSARLAVSSELVGFDAFRGSGLPLMERSSFALGAAIAGAPGVKTYVAVGGTATSDAGAGFLQGLGAKFYDSDGALIYAPLTPMTLHNVARADLAALGQYDLHGIIDVRARLVEGELSALDFARQKALPGEDLSGLGSAMAHFRDVLGGGSEWDGAGGGLGYALASVAGAPCRSGAETAIELMNIDWQSVDLVITGEGHVDAQTVRGGKLVDALWRKASSLGIPTVVLCGIADENLPYENLGRIDSQWAQAVMRQFPKLSVVK